jgi:hypothetical protein
MGKEYNTTSHYAENDLTGRDINMHNKHLTANHAIEMINHILGAEINASHDTEDGTKWVFSQNNFILELISHQVSPEGESLDLHYTKRLALPAPHIDIFFQNIKSIDHDPNLPHRIRFIQGSDLLYSVFTVNRDGSVQIELGTSQTQSTTN